MNAKKLQSTGDKVRMVEDFRKITDASGLNIYMYGWLFIQIEQFIFLQSHFYFAAAIAMLIVWACSLMFGLSWLSALINATFAIIMCIEIYGSLYAWDISYQTLAATSMLMSIGISVEFIAHPLAAFEFAIGTRDERLVEARHLGSISRRDLAEMSASGPRRARLCASHGWSAPSQAMSKTGVPVIFGMVSSLVGFLFLLTSDFTFVIKYFFAPFFMMCVFGFINAIIFLPAILGLFGGAKSKDGFAEAVAEGSELETKGPVEVHTSVETKTV